MENALKIASGGPGALGIGLGLAAGFLVECAGPGERFTAWVRCKSRMFQYVVLQLTSR